MIPFLISILWFLLYAGLVYLAVWIIIYFIGQLKGSPVAPRAQQIIYAVVGILLVIWALTTISGGGQIAPPWQWSAPRAPVVR